MRANINNADIKLIYKIAQKKTAKCAAPSKNKAAKYAASVPKIPSQKKDVLVYVFNL